MGQSFVRSAKDIAKYDDSRQKGQASRIDGSSSAQPDLISMFGDPPQVPQAPPPFNFNNVGTNMMGMTSQQPGFMRSAKNFGDDFQQPNFPPPILQPPMMLPPMIPGTNLPGMAMQPSGFVRSVSSVPFDTMNVLSNSMGFVRSAKTTPAVPLAPPPKIDSSFDIPMGIFDDQPTLPFPLPPVSSLPPKPTIRTVTATIATPETSEKTEIKLEFAVSSWSWYNVMTENEIKKELKNLNELSSRGFIQDHEYQDRKKELDALLVKSIGHRNVKKSSRKSGSKSKKERSIRVFLSSTFRDMQRERDELIKQVFPVLKRECAERGIAFTEVDLRWGITAEQSERGEVLGLCLQEIDKCRPYFINIIGSRYGYIPATIPLYLRERYPFLPNTDIEENSKSVTEFEVLYGALNDPTKSQAHFYFKSGFEEGIDGVGDHPDKIAALKTRIKNSGLPNREYDSIKRLGDHILQDLRADIDVNFPIDQDLNPTEIENASHETYAELRAKVYISRASYFKKIYQYLEDDGSNPLAIIGDSGSGKSSLLANFCLRHESDPSNDSDLVILHFCGTSPSSADHGSLISRVVNTIKTEFNLEENVPTDPRTIIKDFPNWIQMIPNNRRLILVIDALNQLDDKDQAHSLNWIPINAKLPSNKIKVIVSTLENTASFKALTEREYQTLRIEPLEREERETLCSEYLALFGKSFDHIQLQRICIAPQTKNPLFLRAMLEELRLHGVYEEINSKIESYLEANTISELFQLILRRLENDFHPREKPTIVRDVMSLIFMSRRGLTDSELIEILGINRVVFSPFFFAIQEFLVSRSGLYNFFHDYLRQAVEKKYLTSDSLKTDYQLRIASYFETVKDSIDRKADELPYHLFKAGQYSRLVNCISDIDVFLKLNHKSRKYELKGYWLSMGSGYSASSSYQQVALIYESTKPPMDRLIRLLLKIGRFLREMVQYDGAESMLKKAYEYSNRFYGEYHLVTAKSLYLLAELYWNQSRWSEAEPLAIRALNIREKLLGPDEPEVAMALMGIGEMEMRKPGHGKAQGMIERALKIRVQKFGTEHPLVSRCLQDLAIIADNNGESDKAVQLCSQALKIREKALGPNHPHTATSYETLGSIYKMRKESHLAEPLMRKAIEVNEMVHGELHPSVVSSCEWYILILKDLNKIDEAAIYQHKVDRIQSIIGIVTERIAD